MMSDKATDQSPRFRFAPSPNGRLHLGHAYSALLNQKLADENGGEFLLRIEDIDLNRCTPELEASIYDDLAWLGLRFAEPVRRQSAHFLDYAKALQTLIDRGLVYRAFMTRGEIKAYVRQSEESHGPWPRDPDGAPLYPPEDKALSQAKAEALISSGKAYAWRLDMAKALATLNQGLFWRESGTGQLENIQADAARWGDVILSRSDAASSYHLSVVVDDALQGITHVVRGMDLYEATSIHRLLQTLLGLPAPQYHHHLLILDSEGKKLSKSIQSTGIGELRSNGASPSDIRALIGL